MCIRDSLEAEARVESIGEAELGRRVIVLSSAEALARSLELRVCEEGSVLQAKRPAATSCYYESMIYAIDLRCV